MKRSTFLRILSISCAVLASPISSIAKGYQLLREKAGYKTDTGADRFQKPISLFDGDTFIPRYRLKILTATCTSTNRRA